MEINGQLKEKVFAVGKPEIIDYYKDHNFQVHTISSSSKTLIPYNSFMITSIKEEEVDDLVDIIKEQVIQTKLQPYIFVIENNVSFFEKA